MGAGAGGVAGVGAGEGARRALGTPAASPLEAEGLSPADVQYYMRMLQTWHERNDAPNRARTGPLYPGVYRGVCRGQGGGGGR